MITVKELGALLNGVIKGDDSVEISGISSVEDAVSGDVVVAENEKYFSAAMKSSASAVVSTFSGNVDKKTVIVVDNVQKALKTLLPIFSTCGFTFQGIHPQAVIGENCVIGKNVGIGPGVVLADNVKVGEGARIHPSTFIGNNVVMGQDVVIHPNVTIYPGTVIGNRVTVHAGAVIGADGFGYVFEDGAHQKIEHVGKVIIEDDVEIGACATIDRAKVGVTRIGEGTKIDNLVHIAHNCKIGKKCLVIALAGVAGSCVLGDGVVLAGQAGVKDHVRIGDGSIIAARAGVIGDVAPGSKLSGFPARPHMEYLKSQAAAMKLPDLASTIRALEARVVELEEKLKNGDEVEAGK
jgi:UDP-3-O-[3-hydroxymyristoyl] glucosamine N-acyltransferase